ncbi:MAG: hypothetical protein QOD62_1876 [Actinomycetota bacterium]|nr:hypothetical protein [Actinomycetota bacterium]
MGVGDGGLREEALTVVVVDDNEDIRFLLRMALEVDGRFSVVGEGVDGLEAIALAERLHPQLLILDRQMPNLDGLGALPVIRARAPGTAVVLYTAQGDAGSYQAAMAEGAVGVLAKTGDSRLLLEEIVNLLASRSETEADVEVQIGPVAPAAAAAWINSASDNLTVLTRRPGGLPDGLDADVLHDLVGIVELWRSILSPTQEFRWTARTNTVDALRVRAGWLALQQLDDAEFEALGCRPRPPESEAFHLALAEALGTD